MHLSLVAGWGETTTSPNLGSDELVFCISQLLYWVIFEYIFLCYDSFEVGILQGFFNSVFGLLHCSVAYWGFFNNKHSDAA